MTAVPARQGNRIRLTAGSGSSELISGIYVMKFPATLSIFLFFTLASCTGGGSAGSNGGTNPDEPEWGLDLRPTNLSCTAFDPEGGISVILAPEFSNLIFNQPVALAQHPTDDQRWYVVEQSGRIRTFKEGENIATLLIDFTSQVVSGGEAGLLGMAFHPQFSTNGEIYLSYTDQGNPLTSRISRVISSDGGLTASVDSETILLSVDQPYSNHNGGWIAFGPDGYLYIGFGDGGSGGDPQNNGQDTTSLLGAMLRIDVDNTDAIRGTPYAIPPGNPFEANLDCTGGCPEIFAWGFRNPWRWGFDTLTGRLWVGDVGQNAREEIDLVSVGENYGWNIMEGTICYPPGTACDSSGLTLPVVDYSRSEGNAVTGGYVYRGSALPSLVGAYIYGDYGSGRIWRLIPDWQGGYENTLLLQSGLNISAFGQDRDGEIYIVSYGNGRIYALAPETGSSVPDRMSDTGYVRATDATRPVDCFIPYDIKAPFWSDGADKERYFAIPDNTYTDINDATNWQLPPGSVTLKSFWLNDQPVEMRILMRHFNGQWAGYSYEWDSQISDFVRVIGGKTKVVDGQTWIYPSESGCMRCHPEAAGRTIGLETAQLNRNTTYPSTGRTANQLTTYDHIMLLDPSLPDAADQLPVLPDPFDTGETFIQRSKAYLHTNCSQCHRPNGPTPSTMDLRYNTAFFDMHACNAPVQGDSLGISDPLILAPGEPDRSLLLQRMQRRDTYGMPPLGSSVVDLEGRDLLEQWISDLSSCP